MKFDLNEEVTAGTVVFNNGVAGKVENVSIDVEKRKADEPDSYPPYKLIVNDGSGAMPINQGFYFDENDTEAKQEQTIQRIRSIAKTVVPEGFEWPVCDTYTEACEALFKIIKQHAGEQKVNVFTSYGWTGKPSKFLGLRNFNFIEKMDEVNSRLKPTPSDVLERPEADAPRAEVGDAPKPDGIW